LVVDDKNVVEYRPVELGPQQPGALQVIQPINVVRTKEGMRPAGEGEKGEPSLKAGESIVVGGLQRVRPGMTVTPQKKDDRVCGVASFLGVVRAMSFRFVGLSLALGSLLLLPACLAAGESPPAVTVFQPLVRETNVHELAGRIEPVEVVALRAPIGG